MMIPVAFTLQAVDDIEDIRDYIAARNPEAADEQVEAFHQDCRRLADHPRWVCNGTTLPATCGSSSSGLT